MAPLALLLLLLSSLPAHDRPHPRVFYAAPAPAGSPRGAGSLDAPWDLGTALAGGTRLIRVQPGDTILLRGGVYRGAFRSTVSGRAGAPVVVRQYPGERAILDGAGQSRSTLAVRGEHSVFWGFELTNSDTVRSTPVARRGLRPNVVANYASHTKYINLIIHDGGVAFYTEPGPRDVEVAGCIIYNNGWQGPVRGHGHALYLKSYTGPVVARDNVLFNQFGYGVHAYTDRGTGRLVNITIAGNVAFNNGTAAARPGAEPNILVGGADYASGDVVRGNYTYFSPGVRETNVLLGYSPLLNGDIVVEDNYFAGGAPVLEVRQWAAMRVSGNTLVGAGTRVRGGGSRTGHVWRANAEQPRPTRSRVVVRPNPYETGRGMVVVYNWGGEDTARVDPSGLLDVGAAYEVRNVQDLFGAPVTSGRYRGGKIAIPLGGVAPPPPVGMRRARSPRTGPAFDVFLVTRAP